MTNSAAGNNLFKTYDALTKGDYEKLREANDAKVRGELQKESEKDRQKRLWAEENRERRDTLGS